MIHSGKYISRKNPLVDPDQMETIARSIENHIDPSVPFNLNTSGVSGVLMKEVAGYIDMQPLIRAIIWKNIPVGQSAIPHFFESLSYPENIETVTLVVNPQFTDEDYESMSVLKQLPNLNGFIIQKAILNEIHVSNILHALLGCLRITQLGIMDCIFVASDNDMETIGNLFDILLRVDTCAIEKMVFTRTNIDDAFMDSMKLGLEKCKTIQKLVLDYTKITSRSLDILYDAFQPDSNIQTISFAECRNVTGAQQFAQNISEKMGRVVEVYASDYSV